MRKDVLLRIRRTVWRIRHIVWRIRRPVCRLWYIQCCVWRIWRMWHILRSVWCIHRTSRIRRAVWHTKMYCVTHTTYSVTYTTYCLTHLFTAGTVYKNSSSNFAVIEKMWTAKKEQKSILYSNSPSLNPGKVNFNVCREIVVEKNKDRQKRGAWLDVVYLSSPHPWMGHSILVLERQGRSSLFCCVGILCISLTVMK